MWQCVLLYHVHSHVWSLCLAMAQFTNPFIHNYYIRYLLSLGTDLSTGDITMNKVGKASVHRGLIF